VEKLLFNPPINSTKARGYIPNNCPLSRFTNQFVPRSFPQLCLADAGLT
jgi:hypothetical protein